MYEISPKLPFDDIVNAPVVGCTDGTIEDHQYTVRWKFPQDELAECEKIRSEFLDFDDEGSKHGLCIYIKKVTNGIWLSPTVVDADRPCGGDIRLQLSIANVEDDPLTVVLRRGKYCAPVWYSYDRWIIIPQGPYTFDVTCRLLTRMDGPRAGPSSDPDMGPPPYLTVVGGDYWEDVDTRVLLKSRTAFAKMAEKALQDGEAEVWLPDLKGEVLRLMLNFIVRSRWPFVADDDEALLLFLAAHKYKVRMLAEICDDYLCSQVDRRTCIKFLAILGNLVQDARAFKMSVEYFVFHFEEIRSFAVWKRMKRHLPETAHELLMYGYLNKPHCIVFNLVYEELKTINSGPCESPL